MSARQGRSRGGAPQTHRTSTAPTTTTFPRPDRRPRPAWLAVHTDLLAAIKPGRTDTQGITPNAECGRSSDRAARRFRLIGKEKLQRGFQWPPAEPGPSWSHDDSGADEALPLRRRGCITALRADLHSRDERVAPWQDETQGQTPSKKREMARRGLGRSEHPKRMDHRHPPYTLQACLGLPLEPGIVDLGPSRSRWAVSLGGLPRWSPLGFLYQPVPDRPDSRSATFRRRSCTEKSLPMEGANG